MSRVCVDARERARERERALARLTRGRNVPHNCKSRGSIRSMLMWKEEEEEEEEEEEGDRKEIGRR